MARFRAAWSIVEEGGKEMRPSALHLRLRQTIIPSTLRRRIPRAMASSEAKRYAFTSLRIGRRDGRRGGKEGRSERLGKS